MHVRVLDRAVPHPPELRVAVCLSGLQRLNSHALTHFSDSLAPNIRPDYFCFLWPGDHHTESELTDAIVLKIRGKAARMHTTIGVPIHPAMDFHYETTPKVDPQRILNMYYAIEQANAMKRSVEEVEGFRYDLVIRQRTDVALLAPLDLQRYLPLCRQNIIVLPDRGNYVGFNDQFALSSSPGMDVYSSVYGKIRDYCEKGCLLYAEMLLRCHLRHQRAEAVWTSLNAVILRF